MTTDNGTTDEPDAKRAGYAGLVGALGAHGRNPNPNGPRGGRTMSPREAARAAGRRGGVNRYGYSARRSPKSPALPPHPAVIPAAPAPAPCAPGEMIIVDETVQWGDRGE